MHFLIAPDKFKGSLSAKEAAENIALGLIDAAPGASYVLLPLSDGGEGLTESLCHGGQSAIFEVSVTDPCGRPVKAKWGLAADGKTAVIEMAEASGLALLQPEERNPALTTTFGTGELIIAALNHGCRHIIVGCGGSATNDAGLGMARALGASFKDNAGSELGFGGVEIARLKSIDLAKIDRRLKETAIEVACDVQNPLTGPKGASLIYSPQKGAGDKMALKLEEALQHLEAVVKNELGLCLKNMPFGGAAGGLAAGLFAFLGAKLSPGIELVLDAVNFDQHLRGCKLVITGEGSLDSQSLQGKTPLGVARRAGCCKVPAMALAGKISGPLQLYHKAGLTACFAIADGPLSSEESIGRAPELLKNKTGELIRLWLAGSKKTGFYYSP